MLRLMVVRQREKASQFQIITKNRSKDDDANFHGANGEAIALEWAAELLERTVFDPQTSKDSMLTAAEYLEREAKQLRWRAENG